MNKVVLVGRLTKDPEMRQTPQGISVARFTVAVDRKYSKDGERKADFIPCIVWRNTADFLCKYFRKGSGIELSGSIQSRDWTDTEGKKHYAIEVVADEIGFNGPKVETGAYEGYSNMPPASTASNANEYTEDGFFVDVDENEDDLPF